MATSWEKFEVQCVEYLNEKFGTYAQFVHQGGADSTVPDILVRTNFGRLFYIEAKHSPAQCGQFVLLPNLKTRIFEYSPRNVNCINGYAEIITRHMNDNFKAFVKAGTAGKNIDMANGSDIFAGWIIQTYKDKGVEFFITNDYKILPTDHFQDYFDVSAKYRIKRSGSSGVGRSNIDAVTKYITAHYEITNISPTGDKLFVSSPSYLHNERFILDNKEFMFSARDGAYELRKLSNTYNANVIFSIMCKLTAIGLSDADFIRFLK